jgi:hypothetical protein
MIDRWLAERSKELARAPYVSAEKIRSDTRLYSQALRYYGERFLGAFLRRVQRARKGKREAGLVPG